MNEQYHYASIGQGKVACRVELFKTLKPKGRCKKSVLHSSMASNNADDLEDLLVSEHDYDDDDADDRTPLDKTIDRIGMGSYQWTLLSLCGFGWMADNMWIQAVAIILPRVQQHYSIPDSYIGAVSSSMFAGMMFGAVGWGTCSDLMGRITVFNGTLFFTALFGLFASLTDSFLMLCVVLFLLGSAVGGSLPTDGTLLLEHMPKGKQHLVTALSVFFSFGAVFSAIVGLLVLPKHSCIQGIARCNPEENKGWRYMLVTLGVITLSMFLARIVFFRVHESPRYLVHAGRYQEALENLQLISRFNGSELDLDLEDVHDGRKTAPLADHRAHQQDGDTTSLPPPPRTNSPEAMRIEDVTLFDADALGGGGSHEESLRRSGDSSPPDYHATSGSPTGRGGTMSGSPQPRLSGYPPRFPPASPSMEPLRPGLSAHHRMSSGVKAGPRWVQSLPRWVRRPIRGWLDRVAMVLAPEWLRTTLLVWAAWCGLSLAYTMFNVFLPKMLETRSNPAMSNQRLIATSGKPLEDSLWDVVIFTIGGCPGALLGAYMVDSRLGRRWSLAGSTFLTALFCVVFVSVRGSASVRASTVVISLSSTIMWAVLYGWTPEIFGTRVRGTACGIASALSRIGGMIAPLLGGTLLMINNSIPVYTSVVVFVLAGICVLLLKEDAGEGSRRAGRRMLVH